MQATSNQDFNNGLPAITASGIGSLTEISDNQGDKMLKVKADDPNFITEGFETNIDKWTTALTYPPQISTDKAHSGNSSLKVFKAGERVLSVAEGKYKISFYMYDDSGTTKKASAFISIGGAGTGGYSLFGIRNDGKFFGRTGTILDTANKPSNTPGQWVKISVEPNSSGTFDFYIGEDIAKTKVYTSTLTSINTIKFSDWWQTNDAVTAPAYIDDVTIERTDAIPPFLSFENGIGRWSSYDSSITPVISEGIAKSGSESLKIQSKGGISTTLPLSKYKLTAYMYDDGNTSIGDRTGYISIKDILKSTGQVYSDMMLDFKTDDGKADVKIRSVEMPQTNKNCTYVTMEIKFNDELQIDDVANNLSFFKYAVRNAKYPFSKLGYLDKNNNSQVKEIPNDSNISEVIPLGKESPYYDFYGLEDNGKNGGGVNFGFVLRNSKVVIGGQQFNDSLVLSHKSEVGKGNMGSVTLNMKDVTFQKGDSIMLDMILLPWGSPDSTDDSNVKNVRTNYAINSPVISAIKGTVVVDTIIPTINADNGSAEFRYAGGYNNMVVKVNGLKSYAKPKIFENKDGSWVPYDTTFYGYDGYQIMPCEDGSYSIAYVVETDGSEHIFKVEQ